MPMTNSTSPLHAAIAACTVCEAAIGFAPRPVVQFSATSKVVIIGQAPGARVQASGVPWDDDSGARLRAWLGLSEATFYDAAKIALMPMGFCFPGSRKGGDLPPRKECAPLWHHRLLAELPPDRLTLLVGTYAQARYLPRGRYTGMAEAVRELPASSGAMMALPHPAWRSVIWMRNHPWFEDEVLPKLRARLAHLLGKNSI